MNKDVKIPILLDLYGKVLSKAQHEDLDSYYNHDLSLSEIADNVSKSRQGVFDSIKRAELILTKMESKLGFLRKIDKMKSDFKSIEKIIENIQNKANKNSDLESILKITAKYSE